MRRHGAGLTIGGEEFDGFGSDAFDGAAAGSPGGEAFAAGSAAVPDVFGAVAGAVGAGAEIAGGLGTAGVAALGGEGALGGGERFPRAVEIGLGFGGFGGDGVVVGLRGEGEEKEGEAGAMLDCNLPQSLAGLEAKFGGEDPAGALELEPRAVDAGLGKAGLEDKSSRCAGAIVGVGVYEGDGVLVNQDEMAHGSEVGFETGGVFDSDGDGDGLAHRDLRGGHQSARSEGNGAGACGLPETERGA